MAEQDKKTYRLYAMPLNAASISAAATERFFRATPAPPPGYVLVYTNAPKPLGSEEISAERLSLLSDADERWLLDCGAALLAKDLEEKKPEILSDLSEKIEALEIALQRAKSQLAGKGETASGKQ